MSPPKNKKTALEKQLKELQAKARALDIEAQLKNAKEDIAAKEAFLNKKDERDVDTDIVSETEDDFTIKSGNSFIIFYSI